MFVFIQIYVRIIGLLKRGKKIADIPGRIGELMKTEPRLILYFYTQTCAACKAMSPVIDRLRSEYSNIIKVDLSKDMEIAKKFGVMGTPSLVVVENQEIKNFVMGAKNEAFLRKLIEAES